jgi:hypothetical protein
MEKTYDNDHTGKPVNKGAFKLIHADGFFPPQDVKDMVPWVLGLKYEPMFYGEQIKEFNVIFPGIEDVFSRMLGEKITLDKKRSGIFRKPIRLIHFEDFESLNEWCFVIALQKTTFNIYHHVKDIRHHGYGEVDSRNALEGYEHNYKNLFEWDVVTNVILEPNQGVFFRPWCFHSLENGLIQYYRLLSEGPM